MVRLLVRLLLGVAVCYMVLGVCLAVGVLVQYGLVQYGLAQYGLVQYGLVQYGLVQYGLLVRPWVSPFGAWYLPCGGLFWAGLSFGWFWELRELDSGALPWSELGFPHFGPLVASPLAVLGWGPVLLLLVGLVAVVFVIYEVVPFGWRCFVWVLRLVRLRFLWDLGLWWLVVNIGWGF